MDRVLRRAPVDALLTCFDRDAVVSVVRDELRACRDAIEAGQAAPETDEIAARVVDQIGNSWMVRPQPVINATGVVLHTNLGRAPLSTDAREAMLQAGGYSDLEFDSRSGQRGSRQDAVRHMLRALTNAEDAFVAVNNAAAVMLCLTALARKREVIVARGQAVEIGGGFRIPTILQQSGARLVEVGTTNRTRLADYEAAVTTRTAAILHVHTSNFKIIGFHEEVSLHELSLFADRVGVPVIADNGSGSFIDTGQFGLAHEPMPGEAFAAGVHLVTFSGDKLLGGPQAGVIVGRAELVRRIAQSPLARVVRPDKLVLAALSATLLAYLRGDAVSTLPIWRMISQSAGTVQARAQLWQAAAAARNIHVHLKSGESTIGGGSLPGEVLPTTLIVLHRGISGGSLRTGSPVVMSRSQAGRVLLDLRTVAVEEEASLLDAVAHAQSSIERQKDGVLESVDS